MHLPPGVWQGYQIHTGPNGLTRLPEGKTHSSGIEPTTSNTFKPKAHAEEEEVPGMNEGNPNCQNVLPRTTLSSAGQNHGREKRHVAQGNPLEDHKRDSKPCGLAIGEWWGDNPRRSRHLRIKYPQLTP